MLERVVVKKTHFSIDFLNQVCHICHKIEVPPGRAHTEELRNRVHNPGLRSFFFRRGKCHEGFTQEIAAGKESRILGADRMAQTGTELNNSPVQSSTRRLMMCSKQGLR